jgi:acetyl esterase/lipase
VILHLHGGGFVLGNAGGDLASLQAEARALDAVIVTVDYRLAPEAPFPAPLEDAYAALFWTCHNCASFGGDSKRIAVQGESAGGGLAAMLALLARDRGEVHLVHQSLIYPMLDDRTGSTPVPFPIGRLAWTAPLNEAAWSAFLGQPAGGKAVPMGAVPARAQRLDGLPSTFIGVGSIDLFVSEDIDYARRLIEAAVPTELHVVPGAFHGFDVVAPRASVTRQFQLAQHNALAKAFGSRLSEMRMSHG